MGPAEEYMTASSHPAKPDLTVAETCVQAGPKSDLRFDVIGLHTERNASTFAVV